LIIGIVQQKGGCGKTTTAVHYATWLARHNGGKVCLLDGDAQQSSSKWLARIGSSIHCEHPPAAKVKGTDLIDRIYELEEQFDTVIVDGPGSHSETTRAILLACDLAVLPIQPTGLDLDAASETIRLIRQAQRIRQTGPRALAFLSRATRNTRLLAESKELLGGLHDLIFVEDPVVQRQVVADLYGQGQTVWDTTATDAQEDFERVCTAIQEASNGAA